MQKRQRFSALTCSLWSPLLLDRVFVLLKLLIPGTVENLITRKVQQPVPSLASETRAMACRESSACLSGAGCSKKKCLVPMQKNVGGPGGHTYDTTSVH